VPAGTTDQFLLATRVLVAAAGEDENPALAGAVLNGAVEGGHERVGDVLQHESDRRRLAVEAAQARRVDVTPVIKPLDCGFDARLHLGADTRLSVHDARDGGQSDTGEGRNIVHRRRLCALSLGWYR
jgi:hypothetical protein